MGLYDNHNHSQFSFDGKATSVADSTASAVSKGLSGICFTDHCDFYVPPMKAAFEQLVPEVFEVESQQNEIDRIQQLPETKAAGIQILKGIEIGMQKPCRKQIRQHLHTHQFDQIILSLHYLDQTDPFYGGYYEGKDWKQAYGHYLETILEEITWAGPDFDILGHFDYVVRYARYPQCGIRYQDFPDMLDEILKVLSYEGKALEINTKTYQDFSGRTPVLDENILKRYQEFGGEAISLGSDSHKAEKVGFHFEHFSEYLKHLGFKYEAHYENRKLQMVNL